MKKRFCVLLFVMLTAVFALTVSAETSLQCQHTYSEPQFVWSTVEFTCEASGVCTVCDETEIKDCKVTKSDYPSIGHTPGGVIYTASVDFGGTEYIDTYKVEGNPIGHDYSTPVFSWSEDYETAYIESVCSLCDADDPDKTIMAVCEVREYTEEADCSSAGYTEYTATAQLLDQKWEEKKTVVLPKKEHLYTTPVFTWNESQSGCQAYYECTVGGETFNDVCTIIEEKTYTDCETPGIWKKTAIVTIGDLTVTNPVTIQTEIPARGHDTSIRVPGKEPTCTESGMTDGLQCAICKKIFPGEVLAKSDHTKVSIRGKSPTCTEPGVTEKSYCSVCQEVFQEATVIPATGHTPETVSGYESTCTKTGLTDGEICSVCKTVLKEQELLQLKGHTLLLLDARDATCTEDGYTAGAICSVCDTILTKQTIIPAKGHTKLSVAGYEATCTEDGLTEGCVCKVCETVLVKQEVIPAKGHIPLKQDLQPATCTQPGYTEGNVCSVCNTVLAEPGVIPAKGHISLILESRDATCTEDGCTEGSICSVCQTVLVEQTVIAATGHIPTKLAAKDATCTEDGCLNGSICSVCNMVLHAQTIIPAKGHTPTIKEGQAPTCTEDGYTESSICSVCQVVLEEPNVIAARGHVPIAIEALVPTCTEQGHTAGIVCYVCQAAIEESTELPALGHNFDSAVFVWNDNHEAVSAEKVCSSCKTVLCGEVTTEQSKILDNGKIYVLFSAVAVFPDGTTADDEMKILIDSDTESDEPEVSGGSDISNEPEMPDASETPDKPAEPTVPQFDDVAVDSYYYDAVSWAAKQKITQGTADRIFSPDMVCSRAQVVTMLWRAAGSPIIDGVTAFSDVPSSAYYYHAVLWASKTGITSGTSKNTFSPDLQCSRAQIVTMLWRAAGCPSVTSETAFADVAADAWYAGAVAWAVHEGITLGTGKGVFSPDAVCTRAQIVTFLYRARDLR